MYKKSIQIQSMAVSLGHGQHAVSWFLSIQENIQYVYVMSCHRP